MKKNSLFTTVLAVFVCLFVLSCAQKSKSKASSAPSPAKPPASMNHEEIRKEILVEKKNIKACYDNELKTTKDLHGKIVLQWDIVDTGQTENIKAVSNELNEGLADCIKKVIGKMKFKAPPKKQIARVKFPFIFNAAKPDKK